jgi:hypothetical protein
VRKAAQSRTGSRADLGIAQQNLDVKFSAVPSELGIKRPSKRLRIDDDCIEREVSELVSRVTEEASQSNEACVSPTSSAHTEAPVVGNSKPPPASSNPLQSHVAYSKRSKKALEDLAKLLQRSCKDLKRRLERASEGQKKAEEREAEVKALLSELSKGFDGTSLKSILDARILLSSENRLDVLQKLAEALLSGRLPLSHMIFQRLETTLKNLFETSTKLHRYSELEMSYFSVIKSLSSGNAVLAFMRGLGNSGKAEGNMQRTP